MGVGFKMKKGYQAVIELFTITESGTLTVPRGVNKLIISAIGGGGGSNGAYLASPNNRDNYGDGGIGGSGGEVKSITIDVQLEDVITIELGTGGRGMNRFYESTTDRPKDGNDTVIYLNGVEILRARGGKSAYNRDQSQWAYGRGGNAGRHSSGERDGENGQDGTSTLGIWFSGGGGGGRGTLEFQTPGNIGLGGNRGGGNGGSAGQANTGGGGGGANGSNGGGDYYTSGFAGGMGCALLQVAV